MQRRCLGQPLHSCPETCVFAQNGIAQKTADKLQVTPEVIQGIKGGLQEVKTMQDALGEVRRIQQRTKQFVAKELNVPLGYIDCVIQEFCEKGYSKE